MRSRAFRFPSASRTTGSCRKVCRTTPSDPRKCCTQLDPDSIATWYIDGRQPVAGQIHRNPGLAKTFRILQQQGRDGFYKGEIAQAIVDKSNRHGGTMTLEDLASYSGEWTTPATTNYHGYDVFTLPPPAQTWATEEILNILEVCVPKWAPGQTLASLGPANPKYWHLFVEAKKLAFNDLYAFNADPNFSKVPLERLLSKAHAESLCGKVDPNRATATKAGGNAKSDGDTIVLSTADRFGNMVAWVNSLYDGRSARASPFRATASRCTTAAACSRSIRRARMRSSRTSVRTTRCRQASSCATTSR